MELLERRLREVEGELREMSEGVRAERETATQHAEILAKVSESVCVCRAHCLAWKRYVCG